jgi:hypothetical protein
MVKESQPQDLIYSKAVILSIKSAQSVEKAFLPVTVTMRMGGGGLKVSLANRNQIESFSLHV